MLKIITKDFATTTKLVGVTQVNDSGIPIQVILPTLATEDRLFFIRDYGNKYDNNAIKAFSKNGSHIGYINRDLASEIAPFLDTNKEYDLEGIVKDITGGEDGKAYGCNVCIWIQDQNEPSYEEIKAYQYYSNKNSKPPVKSSHKKKSLVIMLQAFLWAMLIFAIIAITVGGLFPNSKSADNRSYTSSSKSSSEIVDSRLITLNEYNKLRIGMTRSEVYDIVGSFGEKVSESSSDGYRVVMYSYEGYGDLGANAQLMFTNGKLDTMAQYGLKYYFGSSDNESSSEKSSSYKVSSTNTSEKSDIASSYVSDYSGTTTTPVKIENLRFDITIMPPNSIGTVWMEATYTNNSSYTIKSFSLKVLLKDSNKTTYLSCCDTVLPGETSPKFDSFGPNSLLSSDVEFLTCSLWVLDKDGNSIFVDYDYKTKTYNVLG